MSAADKTVDALQRALVREHTAVFGYAVAGAHLGKRAAATAAAHRNAHRTARDGLEALIRARQATPRPAQPTYQLPFQVTDPETARRLAGQLERGTLGAYAALVAVGGRNIRRRAIAAMHASAERQAHWTGSIDPLPGLRT